MAENNGWKLRELRNFIRDHKRLEASRIAGPFPAGRFAVILADPPWEYDFEESSNREVDNHYPTKPVEEIVALSDSQGTPVTSAIADNAVLFLWTTSPKLEQGIDVLKAWGFEYKTCMVWVKDKIGMGYYARQRHELLLIGGKGSLPVPDPEKRPDSVIEAPRTAHSSKPPCVYETIEAMYSDLPRLELFAREERPGWVSWGNQCASTTSRSR